jgi:hypothetical protein
MASSDPAPKVRPIDYAAKVRERWGVEFYERDPAYEWSNGRVFKDSGPNSGIYRPEE